MRVYHFTEHPYPPAWDDPHGYLRVNLPNRALDPKIAADLFHRYYDEFLLADELGLDLMLNEHHQTATCMSSTSVVGLSVLARQTKRARILVLGYPIGHRPDPLRVAEELSTIDVISRGRLDMGFVKGVPYEFAASNANPVGVMDRFWEAHDFIIKAMTTHDGAVQLGERALPLPAGQHLAAAVAAAASAGLEHDREPVERARARRARLRHRGARLGLQHAHALRRLSRGLCLDPQRRASRAPIASPISRCSRPRTTRRRRAGAANSSPAICAPAATSIRRSRTRPAISRSRIPRKLMRGFTPERSFTKDKRVIDMRTGSVQDLIDSVLMFCGTPDQCYRQIVDFIDYTGGLGNLLCMAQAGLLDHADTVDNLTLMAKEIMPRLKEYKQPMGAKIAAA